MPGILSTTDAQPLDPGNASIVQVLTAEGIVSSVVSADDAVYIRESLDEARLPTHPESVSRYGSVAARPEFSLTPDNTQDSGV